MTEKERNLLYGVVSLILPGNILDQFDIVRLEDEDIDRHDGTYKEREEDLLRSALPLCLQRTITRPLSPTHRLSR